MGWSGLEFVAADLADYTPPGSVDLVLSLHACDTATDLAMARGVAWGAGAIVSAPCCQHELHTQLASEPFRALLRHGLLRERMADLVTDALRAAALRVAGYTVKVAEFASPSDTGRNLLVRARRSESEAARDAIEEYRALKAFWSVEPEIERLLKPLFPDRFG